MQDMFGQLRHPEVGRAEHTGHVWSTATSRNGTRRIYRTCLVNRDISTWDAPNMQGMFGQPRHLEVGCAERAGHVWPTATSRSGTRRTCTICLANRDISKWDAPNMHDMFGQLRHLEVGRAEHAGHVWPTATSRSGRKESRKKTNNNNKQDKDAKRQERRTVKRQKKKQQDKKAKR